MPLRLLAIAMITCALGGAAQARVVEDQADLPVEVADSYGKTVAQTIRLTIFRDDAVTVPRPLLVIHHGRASDAQSRATFGRSRFLDASSWFVRQGFIVALPTRIGYGVSGGEDVEDSGPCANKRYHPGYAAAARQTLAALAFMRQRADVLPDRTVLLGQSYGGTTTIALAAQMLPGVALAINFAGGGGGDPKERPERPCSPVQLERLFADYGSTARLPTLWVYTENDRYFGASYPKAWVAAFRAAGGDAEFIQFPPQGEDGHALFVRAPAVWQPAVTAFLRKHGYALGGS